METTYKTLVISDNEILNQLYVVNFEVYLSSDAVICNSFKEAEIFLEDEESSSIHLIVCMNSINGHETAEEVNRIILSKKSKIPLIIVGSPKEMIQEAVVVQSSFHLQNLLRAAAKILGVTAKDMASLSMNQFYAVKFSMIELLMTSPCSLYMQSKDSRGEADFVLIAKKGDALESLIAKLKSENVNEILVKSFDRLVVINTVTEELILRTGNLENASVEEKTELLNESFNFLANQFCQTEEGKEELINLAMNCTKIMDDMVKESKGLNNLLKILTAQKTGYLFQHSLLASFVSSHIVKRVSWGGESHIEKVNFVLLFHDIYLAPIYEKYPHYKYEEDIIFNENIPDKDKEVVLNHARLSAEIVIKYKKTPLGSDLLIKQHHGITNGIGFATDFKDDISPISKVVIISEAFIEEYFRELDKNSDYKFDVHQIITVLNERFSKASYRKIIETLTTLTA